MSITRLACAKNVKRSLAVKNRSDVPIYGTAVSVDVIYGVRGSNGDVLCSAGAYHQTRWRCVVTYVMPWLPVQSAASVMNSV